MKALFDALLWIYLAFQKSKENLGQKSFMRSTPDDHKKPEFIKIYEKCHYVECHFAVCRSSIWTSYTFYFYFILLKWKNAGPYFLKNLYNKTLYGRN